MSPSKTTVSCFLTRRTLFSKRTDVQDAKDKYANVETSYLLQKIESYHGLSILATNNFQNFDEAFRRRITYCIPIPPPDEATRKRIWASVLPAQIPKSENLPYQELAERFELSGSHIKSAAVSAAYQAAEQDGKILRSTLLQAIREEMTKQGRIVSETEYF